MTIHRLHGKKIRLVPQEQTGQPAWAADAPLPEWVLVHAQQLIGAVRDYQRPTVSRLLDLPADELRLLTVTLAALVPDDQTVTDLLWWNDRIHYELTERKQQAPGLRPHGTHAAFNRHKNAGETPCADCWAAERVFQKLRSRGRRAAARAAS